MLIFTVIKRKIKIDNKEAFILYFKDVTFGALYEQVTAQKSFQEIINATISHEMRNPLKSISTNCRLLEKDEELPERIRERVQTMKISSNLLTSFLHDLVDWTHIKLGHFKKKDAMFDIGETFRDIIKMMKFKADMKQVYCRLEIHRDMP